jgi:hypothetical protein
MVPLFTTGATLAAMAGSDINSNTALSRFLRMNRISNFRFPWGDFKLFNSHFAFICIPLFR